MKTLILISVLIISGACFNKETTPPSPPVLDISEWKVPWEDTRPRDPWVDQHKNVWFVGQRDDYVGVFNRETENFERIELPEGAGPHTVIVNEQGAWYAGNRDAHIGRIDPETRTLVRLDLPGEGLRDVHTMDFNSQGQIWFTAQHANQIGLYDPNNEHFTLFDVPAEGSRPYGLVVNENDQPWVVLFGTNALATIENDEAKVIRLPRETALPRRMAITSDQSIWYVDYADGYLGRYNPNTNEFQEWRTPSKEKSLPYGMVRDREDRLWFVETGVTPNLFYGFDPEEQDFIGPFPVPSGGDVVRHMYYDEERNEIWFGTDTNFLGRARIL